MGPHARANPSMATTEDKSSKLNSCTMRCSANAHNRGIMCKPASWVNVCIRCQNGTPRRECTVNVAPVAAQEQCRHQDWSEESLCTCSTPKRGQLRT